MSGAKTATDTPESWGAASHGYAIHVAPYLMRSFSDEVVYRLQLSGGETVLEVGAGSGALTELLYQHAGELLAIDFAPKMVELLRERLAEAGAGNVRCEVMDGQALALADDSFDAAASSFTLMLFPDRSKGFSELARVVRPGGRVVVTGWAGPERFELFGLLIMALRAAFPDLPPPKDPPVFSLADPGRFRAEMEACGLADVEVELVSRELVVEGIDQLWRMLTVGAPPVRMMLDQVGPIGQERLREMLADVIQTRYGDGPIVTLNTATVGTGSVR